MIFSMIMPKMNDRIRYKHTFGNRVSFQIFLLSKGTFPPYIFTGKCSCRSSVSPNLSLHEERIQVTFRNRRAMMPAIFGRWQCSHIICLYYGRSVPQRLHSLRPGVAKRGNDSSQVIQGAKDDIPLMCKYIFSPVYLSSKIFLKYCTLFSHYFNNPTYP